MCSKIWIKNIIIYRGSLEFEDTMDLLNCTVGWKPLFENVCTNIQNEIYLMFIIVILENYSSPGARLWSDRGHGAKKGQQYNVPKGWSCSCKVGIQLRLTTYRVLFLNAPPPRLFSTKIRKCLGTNQSCSSMKSFIKEPLAGSWRFFHFGNEQGGRLKNQPVGVIVDNIRFLSRRKSSSSKSQEQRCTHGHVDEYNSIQPGRNKASLLPKGSVPHFIYKCPGHYKYIFNLLPGTQ